MYAGVVHVCHTVEHGLSGGINAFDGGEVVVIRLDAPAHFLYLGSDVAHIEGEMDVTVAGDGGN